MRWTNEERVRRILRELENLLHRLSEDGMDIAEIERQYEKIKHEFGSWFTEDACIFVAS